MKSAEPCVHEWENSLYLSNPPQLRCVKCGQYVGVVQRPPNPFRWVNR